MKEEVFELYEEFLNGMLDNFRMAVKSQYCRNVQKDEFETLKIIYKLLTGFNIGGNYGCSRCIYNVVKSVGELYLKYYEEQQNIGSVEPTDGGETKKTNKGRNKK